MVCGRFAIRGLAVVFTEEDVRTIAVTCIVEIRPSRTAYPIEDVAEKVVLRGAQAERIIEAKGED